MAQKRPRQTDLPSGVRRRQRLRQRARRRRRRAGVGLVLGVAALAAGGLIAAGFGGAVAFRSSCSLSTLRPVSIGQNSFVYAADGSLLGSIPAERNREPVPLRAVSPWVRKGTVAIEDRRFYEHGGVDYEGIARALMRDIRAGKVVEGGSTITQQLVRNLYIGRERTLKRKVKEACLAIKLSRAWSKNRILGTYLNQVYYGNHAYGIEAASQTYFSRPAKKLTLVQAALLAGLPQAPSVFDPFTDARQALIRRNQVLHAMLVNGDIGRRAYRAAVHDTSLHLKPGHLYETIREPYFFSYVRDELIAEYGANTVRSGGLRVYTTIDRRFQRAALASIRKTLYERTDPAAAVVAIDPRNGAIRAMTSLTPSGQHTQFNLVAQARRQAGSTFKTIVLAAAVAQGMDPKTTLYRSTPFTYRPDPFGSCNTNWWCVTTYDNRYLGTTSVETATVHSDNTVFAQLTLDVGPENVAAMAKKLGVETPLSTPDGAYVPSLGLGAIAVSPLDMASAYATLAAGGVRSKPMAIRRVVLAGGKVDTDAGWGKPQRTRVLSDGVASTVTHVLEQNMLYGTGVGAYFGRPSAGKTGTTDNYADAWFCGYTPNLEATIWVGYPRAEIPMLNVHGSIVSGPGFPATIWKLFMESAIGNSPAADFPDPKQEPHFTPWQKQYSVTYVPPPAPASPPPAATPATTPAATTPEPTTNGPTTGGPPADPN